ncbi:MAG TPA: hypothetical protein DD638_00905, partial [Pasteurellaceae bacterium]|nr:hypothetical protein [Pasteurellaceae bacterium]
GNLNTGNEVGWFTLPISYIQAGIQKHFFIKFEVLPTKIDLHSDLFPIYQAIDTEFPLLRFNFFGKTEQYTSEGKQRGNFPLFWLAHFNALREKLTHNIKLITLSPHQRLQETTSYCKADRLVGKQSNRQLEKIRNDIENGYHDKRYQVTKKFLSTNTPENRFIKWVTNQIQIKINRVLNQLTEKESNFSEHLVSNLREWIQPISKLGKQSFLNEIEPEYSQKASLVLQQKTGYSQVYYIWQELKLYLDFFEQRKNISMKSIAELYEIWCFITLKQILMNLGFEAISSKRNGLRQNKFFEYQLKDGFQGSFEFEKGNIKIRLAHEPVFREKGKKIRTYGVTQKPDILLEVTFPNQQKYIWLFDAKYRIAYGKDLNQEDPIKSDSEDEFFANQQDLVPEDALNQMHRYRDALIYVSDNELNPKSRPVFNAFALYPGFFNQVEQKNPYQQAIEEIGIGAFALLPSQDQSGQKWLEDFLKIKLFLQEEKQSEAIEQLYIENSARIPSLGMSQRYYRNLVMTIRLGDNRDESYIQKFREGSADFYHTKTNIFETSFKHKIVSELSFLAIAYTTKEGRWIIDKIYPILNVEIKPREEISIEQTGSISFNKGDENYYCFTLSKPIELHAPISNVPSDSFRKSIKLPTLDMLNKVTDFEYLGSVYKEALIESLR